MSPNSWVAYGPITTDVTSRTLTPARGPVASGPPAGAPLGGGDSGRIAGHNVTPPPRRHNGGVALTYRLATATPGDVAAIVGLVDSAYRGDVSRQGWTTEADLLDGQRTDAEAVGALIADGARGRSVMLLAFDGVDLIGCCHLEERAPGEAYFGMFAVRPDGQGRGRGGAILSEAERITAEWGAAQLTMTVIKQRHDLIAWYERRGYRRTGQSRPFPYGDPRFGIPTRPDLEFIVLAKPLP
jgi:GNAT superfamily N-acetyltransferase